MVMTFVLTPWSHYDTITKHRARFLLSLMEDLSIDFPSHMIVSIIDCYQDTTTQQDITTYDKLIFPLAITNILTHMHVTIPPSLLFNVMGAKSKDSIWKSVAQLAAKQPRVEMMNVASTPRPSFTSTPSSSFKADVSLADIIDQLQHTRASFGSRLNHLFDEMCLMNTKISHIARCQSCLGGFVPSPSLELAEKSSSNGDDDDDADGSGLYSDDEMATFQ